MIPLPSKEVKANIICLPKFLPDTLQTKERNTAKAEEKEETIGEEAEDLTIKVRNLKTNLKLKAKNNLE